MTSTPHPRPPGRPRAELPLARIRELAALGLAVPHVASRLGVSTRTLQSRMAECPEVKQAFEDGLAEGIEFAARTLQDLAKAGNIAGLIFYLKTRGGWTVPREPAAQPIVINLAAEPAPITIDHAIELADYQERIMSECIAEEEMGGPAD